MQSVCSNRMREKRHLSGKGKRKIEVWDLSGFKMEGCPYKLRVVRYHEQWEENGKETERFMWLVTTLEVADSTRYYEMMHRR